MAMTGSSDAGLAFAAMAPHSLAPLAQLPARPHRAPAAVAESRAPFPSERKGLALALLASFPFVLRRRAVRRAVRLGRLMRHRASVFEQTTLEAGRRLLEEAVEASQKGTNPTQFQNFAQAKNRQSFVSQQSSEQGDEDPNAVDADGLPLVYSVERIAKFWDLKPTDLSDRWRTFLRISSPFIARFFFSVLNNRLWEDEASLARQAVDNLTELGPTFVKLGQVLSIRPDVLPPVTMKELSRLQDNIKIFSNEEARRIVESELGRPIDEMFSSFGEAPIAAASLAQVYKARLRETDEEVAVKVQRPGALATVSKDLYVLRKLADVVQPLIRRFTADETDYIALTETFAEGLYTELDFRNEALNALKMEELLLKFAENKAISRLIIPKPLLYLSTRRVMLSKWVNGVKLSSLPAHEIKDLIAIGQECFLTQLLEIGFFHGDPHPGNLLKVIDGPDAGKLCLLDFGLVAKIPELERDIIVSAVIHLGTQNWEGLVDDFVRLGFLDKSVDRGFLIPVLQRILEPYLKGGGANSMKGMNFQSLSQDLLKVNTQVKFSIPPYVALLARSVATLEGVALQGDPGYQIVAEAYPFVVRKLLKNETRSSFGALRELLYEPNTQRLKPQRLSTMLQASLGMVADASGRSGFIDFDTAPEEGAPLSDVATFLLSDNAVNLRPLLNAELAYGFDLTIRRSRRRLSSRLQELLVPRLPLFGLRLPMPPLPPLMLPVPNGGSSSSRFPFRLMKVSDVLDAMLPELSPSDDVDQRTFQEAARSALFGTVEFPELRPQAVLGLLRALAPNNDREHKEPLEVAVSEVAQTLRTILLGPKTRKVLTEEVIGSVSRELVRTWQARLNAVLS